MSSVPPNASSDEASIFIEARDAFLKSLQPQQRALFSSCSSPEQLIHDLKKYRAPFKESPVPKFVSKISNLNLSLESYFGAIDLFVQSHPEIAAIAWGGIRLALQLASNYASFFDKLIATLETLAREFPQYDDVITKFKGNALPPRLRQSLCSIYTLLLRFIQSVVIVFSKKSGGRRNSFAIVADICTKPYDARFKELLECLHYHRKLIESEILFSTYYELREMRQTAWNQAQHASEHNKKLAWKLEEAQASLKQLKDAELRGQELMAQKPDIKRIIQQIHDWLESPKFATEFERACELREGSTAQWHFQEQEYIAWQEFSSSQAGPPYSDTKDRLLWIQGNPGCGKTILAATTVERLQGLQNTETTCYFFFRAGDSALESAYQAFRSILSQILRAHDQEQALIDKFEFSMQHRSSAQRKASEREVLDLLRICAESGYVQKIVLDGIDECRDHPRLLEHLREIMSGSRKTKAMLFSRPHVQLPRRFVVEHRIQVGCSTTSDIGIYLDRQLRDLFEDGLLPQGDHVGPTIDRLLVVANGMFLWARLLVQYLASPSLTKTRRMKALCSLTSPEGLDKMYDRIFELLFERSDSDQKFAAWVLMWLAFSYRDLNPGELQASFSVRSTDPSENDVDFADFEKAVIYGTVSLVEKWTTDAVPTFRLIHLSARNYILSKVDQMDWNFLPSKFDCQLTIARGCLQYISLMTCHFERQSRPIQDSNLASLQARRDTMGGTHFPLCQYATSYWVDHLQDFRQYVTRHIMRKLQWSFLHEDMQACAQKPLKDFIREMRSSDLETLFSTASEEFAAVVSLLSQMVESKSLMAFIELLYTFHVFTTKLHSLRDWADWVSPTSGNFAFQIDSEYLMSVLEDVKEMTVYLPVLHQHWGSTLLQKPELIWDEVTVFTPSRLFKKKTDLTAKFHSSHTADIGNSAANFLSKISAVNKDNEHIGVLSIWPSPLYEGLAAIENSAEVSMDALYSSTTHWFARYELWNVSRHPRLLLSERIELDPEDVWRQYEHSLEDYGNATLRIQFPQSISPCLRRFSVLQNVYEVQRDHRSSSAKIKSCSLPLGLDNILYRYWTDKPIHFSMGDNFPQWRVDRPLMNYSLTFHPDGNSVLFFAKETQHRGLYMAVFEIPSESNFSFSLANPYRRHFDPEHSPESPYLCGKIAIHPSRPIAAFTGRFSIFLWYYGRSTDDLEALSHRLEAHEPDSGDKRARFWCWRAVVKNKHEQFETMAFSVDGKYLVATTTQRDTHFIVQRQQTLVLPLPKVALEIIAGRQSEQVVQSTQSSSALSRSHEKSMSSANTSSHVIASDSAAAGTTTSASSGALKVNLFSRNRETQTSAELEVVRLPDSWGVTNGVDASMQLVNSKNATVRAILTQTPRPYCNMGDSISNYSMMQLPAVIDSEIPRIRVTYTENIKHVDARKLLTSVIGEPRRIEEVDSESSASKRIRREE